MKNNLKSEWITANAGSGKTTALTERVVRLLLLGVAPEHIVCITYTKAAAAEMRHRVLASLRKLLLEPEAAARARIETLLGTPATDAQLAHARTLFGQVLDSPSGGVVLTTIHGFCQMLLRRFPLEAGVAPHFAVLEDAAADDLIARVKHVLLSGVTNADPALAQAFSIIGSGGGESGFETVVADILKHRRRFETLWNMQSPESLRAHLFAFHGLEEEASEETLAAALCNALTPPLEAALRAELPAMLGHKKKAEQKYAAGFARWLEVEGDARRERIAELVALIYTQKGELRADSAKLESVIANPQGAASLLIEATVRYVEQTTALACANETHAVCVLAHKLLDLYAQAKQSAHALDYDDLIDHTLRLCSHPDTLGWVMSKLDHRIDHLLIDEAQDNSGEQWQLAQVLVEELIASNDGLGSANQPRSLLVVGDEKQSIYSFQGAAPEQFQHNRRHFSVMLEGSNAPIVERVLDHSYRSVQSVLTLVDRVCAEPSMADALSSSGTMHPHQLKRPGEAGRVVLYPPIIAPENESHPPMVIPTEYRMQSTAPQQLAEQIAEKIHQWLMIEKRQLRSQNRPLRPGDMLILVNKRKPHVAPLIRALQRLGVPVAGIDRLTLSEHLAVRDLLALMAWCDNTGDDLALAQVLRSPLVGISDEALRAHAFGREGSLWQAVGDAYPWLIEARQHRRDTPYDFLTWVLEVSNRRRDFARRFGAEIHEVLDEVKAQAATMPAGMPTTISQFHAWLNSSERQIKREQEGGDADLVRIMTVHGAKGLEAPVVIMADTVSVPTTQYERSFFMASKHGQILPVLGLSKKGKCAPRLEQAKDAKKQQLLAEYNRLLYVALTRARDELHIFGTASKKGDVKEGSWYQRVEAAMQAIAHEADDGSWQLVDEGAIARPTGESQQLVEAASQLPAWIFTPPPALASISAHTTPSQAQPSPYIARAGSSTRERGVRIHKVLELLSASSTADDIAALVGYLAPDWSASEQAQVTAEITQLFTAEAWLWQHPRMAEASITGQVEGRTINGQIDLLVSTPTARIIVDYKTARTIPTTAAEVSDSYRAQLASYKALVAQLYPGETIRCAILWTHGPRLMWLDEVVVE